MEIIVFFSFSYDKKENERTGKYSLNGNGKIKLNLKQRKVNLGGGFEAVLDQQFYDDAHTIQGQHINVNIKYDVDKNSGSFSIQGGTSETLKDLTAKACPTPDSCCDMKIKLSLEKLKQSYQGSVNYGSTGADAVLDITSSEDQETCIRSLKITRTLENEPKMTLNMKVYRQPGKETDLDLVKTDVNKF